MIKLVHKSAIGIGNQKGVILITTYLIIAVLLTFSLVFVSRSINEKNIAQRQKNSAAALYIAEAGLDAGLVWLRSQGSPPQGTVKINLFGGKQSLGEGNYDVYIDPDDDNPGNFLKQYQIIVVHI